MIKFTSGFNILVLKRLSNFLLETYSKEYKREISEVGD